MLERPASAVNWAHSFISPALRPGTAVVDATAGNGRDTLFLASGVGPSGRVYAFDIQAKALEETGRKLKKAGLDQRVKLINEGHQDMKQHIKEPVSAVMFNLGYLPGGDHGVITRAETTMAAMRAGLNLMLPGGRMSIIIYTGHPGAQQEREVVEGEALSLSPTLFNVLRLTFWNRLQGAPVLIFIEKAGVPNEGLAAEKNTGDHQAAGN